MAVFRVPGLTERNYQRKEKAAGEVERNQKRVCHRSQEKMMFSEETCCSCVKCCCVTKKNRSLCSRLGNIEVKGESGRALFGQNGKEKCEMRSLQQLKKFCCA